ncbi:alpha/beta fold hydrolase [Kordiimonas sp. SCSIO 12603]|uniref:alpha/beta fold hydrolase n=1 Tax=Kordiimonas sp. SCSIO 12603 TaxID=2829596 RepID=UPI0021079B14|nr:alpha/beta fold hydrolase [Kordiimonas sp. SCSIO 12603]UTW57170.1 alpha/beta fold hydrolase [Kordiimonas sp. SCSIO 12603]
MKFITRGTTASLLAFAALTPVTAQEAQQQKKLQMEPCFVSGITRGTKCGTIELPVNYNQPNGETVSIHVAIAEARNTEKEADPLFILAGGPGQAAGEYGALVKLAFSGIREKRDIVMIDQRGTGKSYGMNCEMDENVTSMDETLEELGKCHAGMKLDTRQFSMENVLRDMDTIREELGYDKINLWGASWGTRTADAYIKQYPQHVRSMVLDGILPSDIALFETAPKSAQRALEKIIEECEAQSSCNEEFPNFRAQVFDLMEKASNGELHYKGLNPISGKMIDMQVELTMAVESLRSVMYRADGTTLLPFVVNEASNGNIFPMLSPLFGSGGGGMYIGATLSMLCGDEVSRVTPEEAKAAGEGSFARDSYYGVWSQMCTKWNYEVPTWDYKTPVDTDIPTLVLSGNLDPITPPEFGDHYMKGVSNGRHIVVQGTGHNTSFTACMPELMTEFITTLDVEALDTSCLDHLKRMPIIIGANGNVK